MAGHPFGEPRDVVPEGFDVRTMVHEYGGGAYAVHGGAVIVSRHPEGRLYRIDPGQAPEPITPDVGDGAWRFADGRVTADGRWWIGVRERHDLGEGPAAVVNELVALPTDGSAAPRVLVGGRDFYANPRISPDGRRLSFLAWDLPWMPWDGTELSVVELTAGAELAGTPTVVAGACPGESIWQPEWSPDGDLVFASDRSGWWNLERIRGDERTVLHAAEAEFGYPQWVFGDRSFAFLGDGRIACCYGAEGRTAFADPRPCLGGAARPRPAARCPALGSLRRGRGDGDRGRSRAPPTCRTRSCGSTSTPGPSRCCARASASRSTPRACPARARSSSRPRAV